MINKTWVKDKLNERRRLVLTFQPSSFEFFSFKRRENSVCIELSYYINRKHHKVSKKINRKRDFTKSPVREFVKDKRIPRRA